MSASKWQWQKKSESTTHVQLLCLQKDIVLTKLLRGRPLPANTEHLCTLRRNASSNTAQTGSSARIAPSTDYASTTAQQQHPDLRRAAPISAYDALYGNTGYGAATTSASTTSQNPSHVNTPQSQQPGYGNTSQNQGYGNIAPSSGYTHPVRHTGHGGAALHAPTTNQQQGFTDNDSGWDLNAHRQTRG